MRDIEINTMEIIEELKKQIAELSYTNSILNVKCDKLNAIILDLESKE